MQGLSLYKNIEFFCDIYGDATDIIQLNLTTAQYVHYCYCVKCRLFTNAVTNYALFLFVVQPRKFSLINRLSKMLENKFFITFFKQIKMRKQVNG